MMKMHVETFVIAGVNITLSFAKDKTYSCLDLKNPATETPIKLYITFTNLLIHFDYISNKKESPTN